MRHVAKTDSVTKESVKGVLSEALDTIDKHYAEGVIRRMEDDGKRTLGLFFVDGIMKAVTLEPPWKNNERSVSCIPAGEYFADLRVHARFGEILALTPVENRDPIYIHVGNWLKDTKGCILVGKRKIVDENDDDMILMSRIAMNDIVAALGAWRKMRLTIEPVPA
jgi:hypothetical protein